MKNSRRPGQIDLLPCGSKQLLLASAVAGLVGSASAFLRFGLKRATGTRLAHRWLIWLWPGGIAIVACAWFLGANRYIDPGISLRRRKNKT